MTKPLTHIGALPQPSRWQGLVLAIVLWMVSGLVLAIPQTNISTTKPISEIKVGDEVLAWDEQAAFDTDAKAEQGQQDQAKAVTQKYEKVTDIISSHKAQTLVHITLDTGEVLIATDGHPFKISEGWRNAVLLKKGGKLLLKDSGDEADSTKQYATITDVRTEVKTIPVFNLEVANLHTYYVGEDGVVVHNGYRDKKLGDLDHNADGPFSWIHPERHTSNRTLKRRWSKCKKQPFPAKHDAHHKGPLADGYPDHESNIEPLNKRDHIEVHNEDRKRWGSR